MTKDCGNADCFSNIDLFCAFNCFANVNCGINGLLQDSMCITDKTSNCAANCQFCYKNLLEVFTYCHPPQSVSEDPCLNGNITYSCNSNYFSCKCEYKPQLGSHNLICSGVTVNNNNNQSVILVNPDLLSTTGIISKIFFQIFKRVILRENSYI